MITPTDRRKLAEQQWERVRRIGAALLHADTQRPDSALEAARAARFELEMIEGTEAAAARTVCLAIERALDAGTSDVSARREAMPQDRAAAMVANLEAAQAFQRAAHRLIAQYRPPDEWSETEKIGMGIVSALVPLFQGGAPADALPWLRGALDALDGSDAVRWRAFYAERVVSEWAERWQAAEASERVGALLDGLVRELALHDSAFEVLSDHHAPLAAKLDVYAAASKGKRGRKGAGRILAELIVELEIDALGVVDDLSEVESPTVADVRDLLARHVARCRAQMKG